MAEWYYTQDGQQMGPVSGSQLKALAASGTLSREDLVWNQSLPEWAAAGKIRGLVFGAPSGAAAAEPMPPAEVYPPEEPPAEEYYEQAASTDAAAAEPPATVEYQSQGGEGIPATARAIDLLRKTGPWVRLFSILLFIVGSIFVLFGVVFLAIGILNMVSGGGAAASLMAVLSLVITVLYIGVGCVYFVPGMYLHRFAWQIKKLVRTGNNQDLEAALEAQRSFWKFSGIAAIVVLAIYLITAALIFSFRH